LTRRLFQRFDDQSPYQFLMRLKMNAAALQLQDPSALIKEIAYKLGFSSAFHFSRRFKKTYGVSPDTFRRLR
jgi:AraC-like DNA-binding protein